jgi:hypothetical protein
MEERMKDIKAGMLVVLLLVSLLNSFGIVYLIVRKDHREVM